MLTYLGGHRVGQRTGLSTTDVDKLWIVYQCYGGQVGQCSQGRGVDTGSSDSSELYDEDEKDEDEQKLNKG